MIRASLKKMRNRKKASFINAGETQHHIQNAGQTPLTFAVKKGNFALCKLLIEEADADVSVENEDGESPLCLAIIHAHSDIMKLLVKHAKSPKALQVAKEHAIIARGRRKLDKEAALPSPLLKAESLCQWNLRREDTLPCRMRMATS